MSGQTIAEKILSRAVGGRVQAGQIAITSVDGAMATDTTAPFAIRAFQQMGGTRLWDADRFKLVIDHAAPAPNERIANLHRMMREFAAETGCQLYDVGEGICHQVMVENAHVRPGDVFFGADSHTPTYGALNAFAAGMGSTDIAGIMLTGQTWIKVPHTIRITLNGRLQPGVSAKDVILFLVGQIGLDGGTYHCIEIDGPAIEPLSLASRMTLANMTSEMGVKAGIVHPVGLALPYDFEPVVADRDANYLSSHRYNVSGLEPQIAVPHAPDNVQPVTALRGVKIQQAFIGSCTNARLEDLQEAAAVLRGRYIAHGVRLIITPASKRVMQAAVQDGTAAILMEAGASFTTPGCGACVGTHMGIPGNDEVVISSTNRNFRGRMGNPNASVYLASPAVVAASALAGEIISPVDVSPAPVAGKAAS